MLVRRVSRAVPARWDPQGLPDRLVNPAQEEILEPLEPLVTQVQMGLLVLLVLQEAQGLWERQDWLDLRALVVL